ncbi:hypothetical protein BKA82DRAFT_4049448 [Pisolithus tinctorius]|nr:hypothetical protein BKA82DRAFT_4049448 [Pisolithus tinctorius]
MWSLHHIMHSDPRRRATFGVTIENMEMRFWFACQAITLYVISLLLVVMCPFRDTLKGTLDLMACEVGAQQYLFHRATSNQSFKIKEVFLPSNLGSILSVPWNLFGGFKYGHCFTTLTRLWC